MGEVVLRPKRKRLEKPNMTKHQLSELRKQRSILESAVRKLQDVYIPHATLGSRSQLSMDSAIASLEMLADEFDAYIIANSTDEQLDS